MIPRPLRCLVERQTALGKTLLPQTLTSLLKGATDGAALPKPTQKPAIFELLRVGANLCMDHGMFVLPSSKTIHSVTGPI